MCVTQTAKRRRRQILNDPRYSNKRRDAIASQRQAEAKQRRAQERAQKKTKA
jgi:hypothetical protein